MVQILNTISATLIQGSWNQVVRSNEAKQLNISCHYSCAIIVIFIEKDIREQVEVNIST